MRVAVALLALAPLASADVRVVSPTGPYTQVQAAVNASNDGDLILVKSAPFYYTGFTIQAKSLTVVAEVNTVVSFNGAVSVIDLTPGQSVAIEGIYVNGAVYIGVNSNPGLVLTNNQGSVRCERCSFYGAFWDWNQLDGYDGVWIDNSADVSLVACTSYGGVGAPAEWDPNPPVGGCGVRCQSSTLTICDSTLDGGGGDMSSSGLGESGSGGIGLHASGCTIFASHTVIHGGPGGQGSVYYGPEPGLGGTGALLDGGSMMRMLGTTIAGGPDGDPTYGGTGPGALGGIYDVLPGTSRTLTVAQNPLREFHPVDLTFHGAPGEQVYLLVGLETAVQWDPLRLANFLIAPPQYRTLLLGTTNASGNLTRSLPFGDLGGAIQSQIYYLQPLFSGAAGAQQLGTPVTLAVLDQAF